MDNIELRKAIRKLISEDYMTLFKNLGLDPEEMMRAKEDAKEDIESSGEEFVDLGKSKFEKEMDVDSFLKDLEHTPSVSSLNEEDGMNEYFYDLHTGPMIDSMEKKMDKSKTYTNKEFLDLFTQKHALQHSQIMQDIKDGLRDRGFNIEESLNEDIDGEYMYTQNLNLIKDAAEFLLSEINDGNMEDWVEDKISKVAENMRAMRDFYKFGDKKEGAEEVEEGIGIGLAMKHGMNVKEETADEMYGLGFSAENRAGRRGHRQKQKGHHSPQSPNSPKALKDEGAGIGLAIKHGMNVKPTNKK